MLVESRSLNDHSILASTLDIAIGDALDKIARCLLSKDTLEASATVSYGPVLEKFAFPNGERDYDSKLSDDGLSPDWTEGEGLRFDRGLRGSRKRDMVFSFTGMFSTASRINQKIEKDNPLTQNQMRLFAKDAMKAAFEQLASRIVLALEACSCSAHQSSCKPGKVVISGGVAANKYLHHVVRMYLDDHGFPNIELIFPPLQYCTDNAVMIAWTGLEMYEAGWTTDLRALAMKKWSLDSAAPEGGILEAENWQRKRQMERETH
ncbi:MAG: hypothetical protein M1831_005040 [Alyxoria varia]|nr:MAG: hypothetical protein M1831_005040 [Alyxoria varia]